MSETRIINRVIDKSSSDIKTYLDLTSDSVAPGNLAKNETAHDKEGEGIVGRFLTEDAEAWAVGQRNGVPVTEEDVTYHNNSYWYAKVAEAEAVVSESCMLIAGQHAEDSEAWAVGERDGVPVENTDETYENNAKHYSVISGSFMHIAGESAENSEAYAKGTRNGNPVEPGDPAYENNAEYYANLASSLCHDMVGATPTADGDHGLVPKPLSADREKYLRGDGTWHTPPGGGGGDIDELMDMCINNDYYATISDDDGTGIIDDDGTEVAGDWKYIIL